MTHHDEEHMEYEYLPDPPQLESPDPDNQWVLFDKETLESYDPPSSLTNKQAALFAAVNLLVAVEFDTSEPMLVADLDEMARGIAGRFEEWLER